MKKSILSLRRFGPWLLNSVGKQTHTPCLVVSFLLLNIFFWCGVLRFRVAWFNFAWSQTGFGFGKSLLFHWFLNVSTHVMYLVCLISSSVIVIVDSLLLVLSSFVVEIDGSVGLMVVVAEDGVVVVKAM